MKIFRILPNVAEFLTSLISSDFGNVEIEAPTLRVGMNYVEVTVSFNDKNLYTPVHSGSPVYLAAENEIKAALGLDKLQNPLVCGFLVKNV